MQITENYDGSCILMPVFYLFIYFFENALSFHIYIPLKFPFFVEERMETWFNAVCLKLLFMPLIKAEGKYS